MDMSALHAHDIAKRFKDVEALKGVSLSVAPGEYVALLGPNGAGKTTLIEIIEGIQKPDRGDIRILGKYWKGNESELHHVLGISFQETHFFDRITVQETLELFASFYSLPDSRVSDILDLVNLRTKRNSWTSKLSGGQRQKLALGVALLHRPRVLLLDEPTTGLDPGSRRDIWDILKNLKSIDHTSMILTTHYMDEAQYLCDRIVMLNEGRILLEGPLDELLKQHPGARNLDDLFLMLTGRRLLD